MSTSDEPVALYDDSGRPCGEAPRSRMRADNLCHAATAVVVRDSEGRVLVHRRTDTKDVYPGRWDFVAGGVVAAGEDPADAALRELAEEVGITGARLAPMNVGYYADEHTTYWGWCYAAVWDGPVAAQADEVAALEWWPLETLLARLDDTSYDWMPDTVSLLGEWLRGRLTQ